MSTDNHAIIAEQFQEAISELFECYTGVAPRISGHNDEVIDSEITAIVTLCDKRIQASASITTSMDSAASVADFPIECCADWLGELANQLGGRLKNKLNGFGVQPVLSTPTTVHGKGLRLHTQADVHHSLRIKFMGGQMLIELAVDLNEDIQLEPQLVECTSEEGSLELF